MTNRPFIVVSGLPGSGKTTLARQLAPLLGLPIIDKDDILDRLFETRGAGDAAWRRALSRESDAMLQSQAMASAGAVLVSFWHVPGMPSDSGTSSDWLRDASNVVVNVGCRCEPEVAAQRFSIRTRHAGHLDGAVDAESVLANLQALARLESFDIGERVEVDTSTSVDAHDVARQVREALSRRTAPDDRASMRAHIEALFTHDADGRMVRVNEPGGGEAPRFFLGRTAHGNVWRFRHDVSDDLRGELESAVLAEPIGDELLALPQRAAVYENLLTRHAPVGRTWTGPAYSFPHELPPALNVIAVTDDNHELLRPHLNGWADDAVIPRPAFAHVVDGHGVSICCSVRTTAVADEAGVDTAAAFRGRGYASHVVAAWASAVRALGRIPLYSTSWDNLASQALARRLRLVRFGADLHLR